MQFQMKTGELLWRHRYIGRWLLWRHTDRLFWRCICGRFHHNAVASQGRFSSAGHHRCIFGSVLLRFRGRIEIDHSYGLRCRGLCCHRGIDSWGRPARPQATARRPAPRVLCRCGSTNHDSADRIVVNSNNFLHRKIIIVDKFRTVPYQICEHISRIPRDTNWLFVTEFAKQWMCENHTSFTLFHSSIWFLCICWLFCLIQAITLCTYDWRILRLYLLQHTTSNNILFAGN